MTLFGENLLLSKRSLNISFDGDECDEIWVNSSDNDGGGCLKNKNPFTTTKVGMKPQIYREWLKE